MTTMQSSERINNYYTASRNDDTAYPELLGEHTADIVIVGAGSTGINTAVELAERGFDVALVEANRVGWGASGRNGGQVTGSLSGDAAIDKQLRGMAGVNATDIMHMLRWHGHEIITQRIKHYAIDCDLQYGHLHTAYRQSDIPELQSAMQHAQEAGIGDHVQWLDKNQVQERLATPLYHGGVLNTYNMHLHSLNLCLGEAAAAVSRGARLFEQSPVLDIDYGNGASEKATIRTTNGIIKANSIILPATPTTAWHRTNSKASYSLPSSATSQPHHCKKGLPKKSTPTTLPYTTAAWYSTTTASPLTTA